MSHVRAVLFDLDGTLLDTLEDIARSANQVLNDQGFPAHPPQAYRQFIGEGVLTLFQRALPAGVDGADLIARCVEGFRVAYGRGWNVVTQPYAGIPELLDALTSRALGLAVLSNKPDAFTRHCVDEYLGRWPFQVVLGAREGVPRKPDPTAAREVASRLGIPAESIVYLGDSAIDMTTARAAGMLPVGAAWGFRSVEELWSSGAAEIISHPLELIEILDGKRPQQSSRWQSTTPEAEQGGCCQVPRVLIESCLVRIGRDIDQRGSRNMRA
jgi:phosphoglycolate phosphatase